MYSYNFINMHVFNLNNFACSKLIIIFNISFISILNFVGNLLFCLILLVILILANFILYADFSFIKSFLQFIIISIIIDKIYYFCVRECVTVIDYNCIYLYLCACTFYYLIYLKLFFVCLFGIMALEMKLLGIVSQKRFFVIFICSGCSNVGSYLFIIFIYINFSLMFL